MAAQELPQELSSENQTPRGNNAVKWPHHFVASLDEDKLGPAVVELFENYSHVPRSKLKRHVEQVRDEAWEVYQYCCIGRMTFLDLSVRLAPQYHDVLARIKSGEKYLDVGCCFGQDIRKLVHDGAPAENIYGADLEAGFFPLGYKLFRDSEKLRATFLAADLTDPSSTVLDELAGTISIIHASSFFHLFDWKTQVRCAKKCVELMRKQPGSLIFGRQGANDVAKERSHPFREGSTIFNHNEASWKTMWADVGAATGTKWRVEVTSGEEAELKEVGRFGGSRRMRYACYMV